MSQRLGHKVAEIVVICTRNIRLKGQRNYFSASKTCYLRETIVTNGRRITGLPKDLISVPEPTVHLFIDLLD